MTAWILSLLVPVLIAALWHGFSLQIACAIAGEDAPRFLRAMWVSWLGGLLGAGAAVAWSFTFGLLVSLFLSSWLAMALGIALQLVVTGGVYRKGLKLSWPAGVGVAGVHGLLSLLVNAVLGWFTVSYLLA